MHLGQEGIQVFPTHRTHMDIGDLPCPVLLDPGLAGVFPLFVLQVAESHLRHGVDLDVELFAGTVEGEFHFVFLERRGEILLAIDRRNDAHTVDCDEPVALPDVDFDLVSGRSGQDGSHGIGVLVVEQDARHEGMNPGLRLFFGAHRIEAQMRGVQFAQQVGH